MSECEKEMCISICECVCAFCFYCQCGWLRERAGSVLQYVVVCCSALQCVAGVFPFLVRASSTTSMLQCAAMCCRVLPCVAVCCRVVQSFAVRCSMGQCVAVGCSVLQCAAEYCKCIAMRCGVLQCAAVCCSVLH